MRFASILAAVVLVGATSGCKDDPGASYACDCAFLTDTDDTSIQKVEVCESTPERAQQAARGCAQSGAPATVQSCSCTAKNEKKDACKAGDCTVLEHR